ncbi:MAG: conjugal transfer protein TraG N-terminal domain-containing protein [Alphaproteobacteria bacterium]|uniref:Conjugal transfer protein TraG N-terminal domain-containing protein n=1 Tax=Candidatus Nitrobium versatile TaxID=2884831 RepID=A0A953J9C9_9BACT|nr:conjugal transfer protein TraG N-terminal domain-containing protein [Candidatus Nitrobium versatile]
METAIVEMAEGAANGLSAFNETGVSPLFKYLYALMGVVSIGIIYKDFKGSQELTSALRSHLFTMIFIWLFFGYGIVTEMDVKHLRTDQNKEWKVKNVPIGLYGAVTVINQLTGWALGSTKGLMKNVDIDFTKMPFAREKYTLRLKRATDRLERSMRQYGQEISYFEKNCKDSSKVDTENVVYNYQLFDKSYIADSAPSDCAARSEALVSNIKNLNKEVAAFENVSEDVLAQYDDRSWFGKVWDDTKDYWSEKVPSVADALEAMIIRLFSTLTIVSAYLYAQALPYFLGIVTNLFFTLYPLFVARALLPGNWTVIVSFIEGYLWLAFIPVIIAAVDGFDADKMSYGDYLSLQDSFITLAKLAIVLSAPALAGFLLFGQRSSNIGMSGVSGMIAGAVVGAATMGASRLISKGSSTPSGSRGAGSSGGDTPVSKVTSGREPGRVSSEPNAFTDGRSAAVTDAGNLKQSISNGAALDNARGHVSGAQDRSGSGPDYVSSQDVVGKISEGKLTEGLSVIPKDVLRKQGAGLLVQDAKTGEVHPVMAKLQKSDNIAGKLGKEEMVYSAMPGGGAGSEAMAQRLNNPQKGDSLNAKSIRDGHQFEYGTSVNPETGGVAHSVKVSDVKWGHVSNTKELSGGEAERWLNNRKT